MSINYAGSVSPIATTSGWKTNFFNTSMAFYSKNSWTLKSDPLYYDESYEKYQNNKEVFGKNQTSSNSSTVKNELETFTEQMQLLDDYLMTTSSNEEAHKPEEFIKTSRSWFCLYKFNFIKKNLLNKHNIY